jgi:biopolymer transport protein ExbB
MNPARLPLLAALAMGVTAHAAEPQAAGTASVAPEFERRLVEASAELSALRERIGREKAPLVEALRGLEDEILTIETEVAQLEIERSGTDGQRLLAESQSEAAHKHIAYLSTLLEESLQGMRQSLRPGEGAALDARLDALKDKLERVGSTAIAPAWDAADLLLAHVERSVGGYAVPGEAVVGETNRLVSGTIAYVGPEVFFMTADGSAVGVLRNRTGAPYPLFRATAKWPTGEAGPFFRYHPGTALLDASGGKAVQLDDARGSVVEHIRKGGVVGYVIIGLGGLAVLISILKLVDLRRLAVDPPAHADRVIQGLASGTEAEAKQAIARLSRTSRELCTTALHYWQHPKEVLQEHLHAVILQQRMHFQRRLPLLAVIVTAAPLLGLLGTVTGMVKTFTLITVYGTGNAARLSSGISEALVTTELGLIVAIPALVVHGFFVHRTRKSLAQLERCSFQLVTAAEEARSRAQPRQVGA